MEGIIRWLWETLSKRVATPYIINWAGIILRLYGLRETECEYNPLAHQISLFGNNYSLIRKARRRLWVTLKIFVAKYSKRLGLREVQILRHLKKHCRRRFHGKYIVQMLDYFTHKGPNGEHKCLVFELLGPSVAWILDKQFHAKVHFHPKTMIAISKQLLKAVKLIHDAGMCHGGKRPLPSFSRFGFKCMYVHTYLGLDIKGTRIVFTCSSLQNASRRRLFKVLGTPETRRQIRVDGKPLDHGLPSQLIKTAKWNGWRHENVEDIRLINFVESFRQGEEPDYKTICKAPPIPGSLLPPEIIFTYRYDHLIDMWRVGCVVRTWCKVTWQIHVLCKLLIIKMNF